MTRLYNNGLSLSDCGVAVDTTRNDLETDHRMYLREGLTRHPMHVGRPLFTAIVAAGN